MISVGNYRNKFGYKLDVGWIEYRVDRRSELGNMFVMRWESERELVVKGYKEWLLKNIELKNKGIKGVVNVYEIGKKYKLKVEEKRRVLNSFEVCEELNKIVRLIKSGKKVKLMCWCSNKSCHGDVIKEVIEGRLRRYVS